MRKLQLLTVLVLVVSGWFSAPVAQAAQTARHAPAHHVKKHRPHAKGTKRAPKLAKKAPARTAPAVAAASPSTDTNTPITKPGDYRFAIQHEGRTRTYRVHVPPGYSPAEPAPLLVALRPGGSAAPDGGMDSLVRESDRQGFVTVFPDAWRSRDGAAWNAGTCCGAQTARVNDVGFIENVVNTVFRQASISRLHIYAAGLSDGGMMAYRLACELPRVFTAVASVGGTDNTVNCTPDKPVSILHLHARNDTRVPFDGLANAKGPSLTSVPATAQKWAKLDGCMETPQPVLQEAGATCEAYNYCRGQAEVRLCTTETGGHSWPGAPKHAPGETPSQALSASRTIWAFFSAH